MARHKLSGAVLMCMRPCCVCGCLRCRTASQRLGGYEETILKVGVVNRPSVSSVLPALRVSLVCFSFFSGGVAPRFLWPSGAERMFGWGADLSACILKLDGQSLDNRRKRRLQSTVCAVSFHSCVCCSGTLPSSAKLSGTDGPVGLW